MTYYLRHRRLWKLTAGILCILLTIIQESWSYCSNENFTDCNYTILCTNRTSRVDIPSCKHAAQVTLVIAGSSNNVLVQSFFSSTNFNSRVRFFMAANNTWAVLDRNAFGFYSYCVKLSLSYNHIKTVRNETFLGLPYLQQLNLSNNYLTDISKKSFVFGTANVLSSLDLSYNNFSNITDKVFENLSKLQSLDLSHNYLVSLSDYCFAGLEGLQSINLSHNLLDSFNVSLLNLKALRFLDASNNMFMSLNSYEFMRLLCLETINFSHNFIKSVDGNFFHPFVELKSIDFSYNQIEGQILTDTFIRNTKLSRVNVCHNKLFYIHQSAFANHSLSEFSFTHNQFSGEINMYTFVGMGQVDRLDLSNQSITALRTMAFSEMKSLTNLNLSRNSIEIIDGIISINNLLTLDLSYNKLKSLNTTHFTGMINLKKLYLQNNALTEVSINSFLEMSSLTTLNLASNRIVFVKPFSLPINSLQILFINCNNYLAGQIESHVFSPAPFLKELDISKSHFTRIKNDSFSNMRAIEKINISFNRINTIEQSSFMYLENLIILDLSHNYVKEIQFTKVGMVKLRVFNVSNNEIEIISKENFEFLQYLEHIDLSLNRIKNIQPNSFNAQAKLQTILLGNNRIRNFDNIFMNYSSITTLDLSSNNFSALNLTIFSGLTYLDVSENAIGPIVSTLLAGISSNIFFLNLSKNKITLLKPGLMVHFPLLRYLNVSKNHISLIRYGTLRGLVNLEVLDISQNNLKELDADLFHECPKIKTLVIDNNKIASFDIERLQNVYSLKRISIGGNPMSCKEVLTHLRNANSTIQLEIDSIDKVYHEDNVKGIQCGVSTYINGTSIQSTTPDYPNRKIEMFQNNTLIGVTLLWCSVISVSVVAILIALFYFRRNVLLLYNARRLRDNTRVSLELDSSGY